MRVRVEFQNGTETLFTEIKQVIQSPSVVILRKKDSDITIDTAQVLFTEKFYDNELAD